MAANVGGLLTSWNPASHLGYWEDNDSVKSVAKALALSNALSLAVAFLVPRLALKRILRRRSAQQLT